MARKRRQTVKESQVTGTTYLRKLLPLVERLHDEVCECDKAGNRRLHCDQSSPLILAGIVQSGRGVAPESAAGERREAARPECETFATASGLVTSRRGSQATRGTRRQADRNAGDRLERLTG